MMIERKYITKVEFDFDDLCFKLMDNGLTVGEVYDKVDELTDEELVALLCEYEVPHIVTKY
jgi:predicted phosphoribosyltransferase